VVTFLKTPERTGVALEELLLKPRVG
jgi:hypothetical protein